MLSILWLILWKLVYQCNAKFVGCEIEKKVQELIDACKDQLLHTEQVREITVIEHSKMERRKEEEMLRINNEFERISRMLLQRKLYLTKQLNVMFDEISKNSISDIATAESQAEYCQHLLGNLIKFRDNHFGNKPPAKPPELEKKPTEIILLNTEFKATLPKLEKEFNELKRSFCDFKYSDIKYPMFDLKSIVCWYI